MDLTLGHQYPNFLFNARLEVDYAEKRQRMVQGNDPESKAMLHSMMQLREVLINHPDIGEKALDGIQQALTDPEFSFFIPSMLFISSHKPVS